MLGKEGGWEDQQSFATMVYNIAPQNEKKVKHKIRNAKEDQESKRKFKVVQPVLKKGVPVRLNQQTLIC